MSPVGPSIQLLEGSIVKRMQDTWRLRIQFMNTWKPQTFILLSFNVGVNFLKVLGTYQASHVEARGQFTGVDSFTT